MKLIFSRLMVMALSTITVFAAVQTNSPVDSQANAVNDFGIIVGQRCSGDGTCRATLWFRDLFVVDLGTLPNGTNSVATGVNNLGEIVGYSNASATGEMHAVLWLWGRIRDLGVLGPEYVSSRATAINDRGTIVGTSCTAVPPTPPFAEPLKCTAFKSQNGSKLLSLGVAPGGVSSWATGINNNGDVVGYGDVPAPSPPFPPDYRHAIHGFVWTQSGSLTHFGGTSQPTYVWG
jgi:probable HAF family extracellular repeat protein